MKLAFLGGTSFVGRAMVEEALHRGHDVLLFHRGKTRPDLFPEARHIFGDRLESLVALMDETIDVLIDTSAYFPRAVRRAAEVPADRYVFISTISVYEIPSKPHASEDHPRQLPPDPKDETITAANYGGLKTLCEDAVAELWGDRAWIIRPTLVVGPWDVTDRLTWWMVQAAAGRPFVAPPRLDQPLQIVDARDLAEFTIAGIEQGRSETVHTVGPDEPLTLGGFLDEVAQTLNVERLAQAAELGPEDRLPLVVPAEADHLFRLSDRRAKTMGLQHRPLKQIITDTLEWYDAQGRPALKAGLTEERQQQLLKQ